MAASERLFLRHPGNPLLEPAGWPYTVNAVMNAGATLVGNETVLLCRVEDRRGFSHLSVARSADGVTGWEIGDAPGLAPSPDHPEEEWGLEDPRISRVDELDCWVVAYTAFGPGGPALSLATTTDFVRFDRLGMVMSPENKNGALFPRRIDGEFVLVHRPVSSHGGAGAWISRSADLSSWSAPVPVLPARGGGWWDSARTGIGAPPIETPEGWLIVYHGVRQTVAGALYRMGAALLDLDDPSRVVRRSDEWLLSPAAEYERVGDVPGVIFPCGLVLLPDGDELRLYYGAADTSVALATASLADVLAYLRTCTSS
jgi:predicted GH43/DUF377 family glycosyl hydrolase